MEEATVSGNIELTVNRGDDGLVHDVVVCIPSRAGENKITLDAKYIERMRPAIETVFRKMDEDKERSAASEWIFPFEHDMAKRSFKESDIRQLDRLKMAFLGQQRWRTAIDVGAHIGVWSVLMAEQFKEVHAFEPFNKTYGCLIKNLKKRKIKNVKPYWTALGNRTGSVGLILNRLGDDHYNSYGVRVKGEGNFPIGRLDDFDIRDVDFLKVDAEGMDAEVLEGAEETIMRDRPMMLIERKKNVGAIDSMIERLNYRRICSFEYDNYYRPIECSTES